MEENNRRRRQNDPPLPHNTNQRYHQTVQNPQQQQQQPQQQAHRTMTGSSSDRYRNPGLNSSPPSAGRTSMGGASAGYSGYYQDPSSTGFSAATGMPQNAMNYQQQAATGYTQDARQPQTFAGSYNPQNMMYNVQQPGAQGTGVYDNSGSSFDARQTAAVPQIMPTELANNFYSESPSTATASAMQQQPPSTAQSAAVYQQGSADNRNTMLNYSSNVPSMGTMATQATSSVPDVNMEESGDYQSTNTDLNQAYTQYQDALKEVASNIAKGLLATAGESLRSVSEWLLSNVNELGLTSDDQSLHADRIKLWNDFNNCWLAVFQKQKDLLEGSLQRGQTLLSEETVQKMMDDLIRHCDNIERFGLVDYQYGVWEEQVVAIAIECLELMKEEHTGATAGPSR